MICELQIRDRFLTNAGLGESLNGLCPARLRIFCSGYKPGGEGITGIQRRAVSRMNNFDVGPASEQGAGADGFIIRMSRNQQSAWGICLLCAREKKAFQFYPATIVFGVHRG